MVDERAECLGNAEIQQYLEGRLQDSQRSSVEKHAARCPKCRTQLVERFEFNRERVISSLTPDEIVQKVQSLCPSASVPVASLEEFESHSLLRRLVLAVILLLLVTLAVAYFMGLISG